MEAGGQQFEDLLKEEVQDSEVREILERLSSADLGGSELATVGAISEATGASPELIGRMLAEIRQDNLQERFGSVLESHGEKLDTHSQSLRTHQSEIETIKATSSGSPRRRYDREVDEEIVRVAEERIRARKAQPYIIGVAALVVLMALMASQKNRANPGQVPYSPKQSVSTTMPDGREIILDDQLNVTVRDRDGSVRKPTAEEERIGQQLGPSMLRRNK